MVKKFLHQQLIVFNFKSRLQVGLSCVLLLMMVLFGCKTQETSLFPNMVSLKGRMLSVGDSLGLVNGLEAVDGYLVLRDEQVGTMYTILKPDLSYCFHFGRKGQGPGEMLQGAACMMTRNGQLILSDLYQLHQHSLENLYNSVDCPVSSPKTKINDTHIWVSDLSDTLFVATGTFPNGKRFKFMNRVGVPFAYVGDYPMEEDTDLPFYVIGCSFMSLMTSHPTSNRFAVGTQYGGMLDVMEWEVSDYSLHRVGGICEFKPQVTSKDIQGTPNFVPTEKTRWGYVRMDSDENYIYALYSGRLQKEGTPYYKGHFVHVFDWSGTPVCQIKLDKNVDDIAIDGNKLYALYEDADIGYDVIEYILPDNWIKE